jgi:hypothetical protein
LLGLTLATFFTLAWDAEARDEADGKARDPIHHEDERSDEESSSLSSSGF